MTLERRLEWAESVITRGAQLAGLDEAKGTCRLLSQAGKVLRHLGARSSPVPLRDELACARALEAAESVASPGAFKLELDEDLQYETTFIARGSLVSAIDTIFADRMRNPVVGALRIRLGFSPAGNERLLSLDCGLSGIAPVLVPLE
jgi:hypothetical protein